MRRSPWLLVIIIALVTSAAFSNSGQARGAATDVVPRIVDLTPVGGEELPLNGSVTFYFNTPMDHPSVESALVVTSASGAQQPVTGTFRWTDDQTATFTPAKPLSRGQDYLFNFKGGAKSKAGLALNGGVSYRVRTVGTLDVAQIIPASGSKDVDADAVITVIFNRPVVPLVPLDEQSKLPNPLTITPPTDGKGTWINTSTFQFKPATPLKGGAAYTVTVKKGLTDPTGAALSADITTAFTTVAPRAIELTPADKTVNVQRDTSVILGFSQPMDRTATEAGFSLNAPGGKPVAGEFTWRPDNKGFTFKPKALLDYGTAYDVVIDKDKTKAATGGTLSAGAKSAFTVVGLPEIVALRPENNSITTSTAVDISFNQPMKLEDFEKQVIIDPAPAKVDYSFDEYGMQNFRILLAVEDKTSYTVTIDPKGVTDKYGTPLKVNPTSKLYTTLPDGRIQLKFAIKLDYPPEANLQTAGPVGLYSAYAPTTRVYSTHRNVGRLDLELYQMTTDQALPFLGGYAYDELRNLGLSDSQLLRAWQVPVENKAQVYRYDLLSISANGPSVPPTATFTCDGAPATRLKIGANAVILKDPPTPSNMRNQPGTSSNIIARISPGTAIAITGGPRCIDGYVWWQTSYNNLTGWIAEGAGDKYFVGPSESSGNNAAPRPTAQPGTGKEPLKPGVYLLRMSSPDLRKDSEPLKHIMVVGTANLTLKMAGTSASAWVTDLQSGQPVAGVSVKFLQVKGEYTSTGYKQLPPVDLGSVKTGPDGVAAVTYPLIEDMYSTQLIAIVQDGNTFAAGSNYLSQGIEPYNYNLSTDFSPTDATVYLYSDRSLYKPGQPVYFKGVLRAKNDVNYALYSGLKTIPIEVFNDAGESILQTESQLTDFGTFSGKFTLDSKAALGGYRVVAKLPQPGKTDPQGKPLFREFARYINVADYRAPEFRVDLNAAASEVVQGDKIRIEVNSSYFFGGALSNVPISWSVQSDDYYFQYTGSGAYNFQDFNEDAGPSDFGNQYGQEVATGKGKTDASGKFVIEIPADLGKTKTSKSLTIEASITDESNQVVSGRASVVVHAGEIYLGAAPQDYVITARQPSKINILSVGWDSKPVPNTDVNVRAVEREWHSVKQVSPDTGKTVWTYEVKENPVTESTVKTDADGKAQFSFTPPRGGAYKVYVTTRDAKGNQVTSSAFVYVAGADYIPWRQRNNYGIDLKADKTAYQIGDTASILIASPFQGAAKAWITIERGGILKSEVIDLPSNSTVYKLPIDASFGPNVFVSAMIVKGVDDKNPIPAFRLGYVQLAVNADRYKLNIDVKPDKEKAGPREQVTYTLKVTDYAGKPVKAEVGVGLTDLAVLSLLPDTSTPIQQFFYNTQSLGVRTAVTLTISVDEQTQTILNTVKGGGGGGPEGGLLQVRQLFVDTPLWNPTVTTDDNGVAQVNVTLPDQLTTWRLDARAVTQPTGELKTTLVGQVTSDLLSTKPLIVRPNTPRFFVAGDQAILGATVNNNTGADQEVTVSIDVKGAVLSGPASTKVTIKNNERARVDFPVKVDPNAASVAVTFSAASADGKFGDAAKPDVSQNDDKSIPVYRYEVPETVATSGTIGKEGGDVLEGIVLPKRLNITQGTLEVRIDPSLSAAAADALKALANTPYDCTEQTTSRLLANAATARAYAKLNIMNPATKATLDDEINIALQRLYSQQHVDGGWGWCVRDYTAPHVTAYAVMALVEAQKVGYTVDADILAKAVAYLGANPPPPNDQAATYLLNRQAITLYALAKAGKGNVSRNNALFAIREKLSIYARAYLLGAIAIVTPSDSGKINTLISDLQNTAITSASGQHWQETYLDTFNWNTDTRTTAIVLSILSDVQPTNALLPQVVRWLMYARSNDAWETRQETAWSVYGLTNWMQISGDLNPVYAFSASVNDRAVIDNTNIATAPDLARKATIQTVNIADLQKDGLNRLLISRTGGDGTLYYTANLNAYLPVDQAQPVNRGLSVTRKYSLASDKTNAPVTGAKIGDNIRVTLTIVVPNDMPYVSVTDPIPAGAEAINPDLVTSSVGAQPQLRFDDPLGSGYGWWWFGDTQLRDEKTVLSAEYLPRGTYTYTYVVRAGIAGTFNVIPATAQQVYFPDVYGRSGGTVFTIAP